MDFKRCISMILCMIMALCLMGCWDQKEIEHRGMVFSTGIDKLIETEDEQKKYLISFEMPILSGGGETGGGVLEKPWILATTGNTVFEAVRQADIRSERPLFFAQNKVLVIGEEIAQQEDIRMMLDFFLRDHELTRNMNVFIVKGTALEVLNVVPYFSDSVGDYLRTLSRVKYKSSRFRATELSCLVEDLKRNGSALVSRVIPSSAGDEVKLAGAAVIKNNRLVGWLGEIENRGTLFIQDKVEGGSIVVSCPICSELGERAETITFEINNVSSKKEVDIRGGKIKFGIVINVEGTIQEHSGWQYHDLLEQEYIRRMEKVVATEITREVQAANNKLQQEFAVDVLGYGSYLKKTHPDFWEEIEEQWNETFFPQVEVDIHSNVMIRRIGTAT